MKIVFMGTPNPAAESLRRILADNHEVVAVYTQPDKPSGRGNKLSASPVKEFALQNDLPVFQPVKIKTPEALEIFQSHNADVAVVVAYGRILPQTYLEAFPKGAINVHFSLLPKYRGAAPVNWAIVNGETKTGVTTMKMDAGLDTGAMLLQLTAQPQYDNQATFAPIMKKEDGLIDWNLTATELRNRVRGFQPFPSSYTLYQGKKLTIWKARQVQESGIGIQGSGIILEAKGEELRVGCGNQTILQIQELQLEGKKRMATRDFLNGIKLAVGERLGS